MERETRSILYGDVRPVAEDISVHGVFVDRASRRQDVGVADAAGFTSYALLDRLSNAAARRLLESRKVRHRSLSSLDDVGKLWTVVVDVQPGRRLLAALLAIAKLGLAYIPVDSQSAANRVKYILQVCNYVSIDNLLPPTKKEINSFARVCLSACLLARLLKNACMDLDEMLRVDRCRDMDELTNF